MQITSFTAGDSITFEQTYADYPSDAGWSASLYISGPSLLTVTSVAGTNGSHTFPLIATQTANLKAGVYQYTVRVTDGTDKISVQTGILDIFANPEQFQSREVLAAKMITLVEKALTNQLSSGEAVDSISIAGRSVSMMSRQELLTERAFWYRELRALRNLRTGKPSGLSQIRITI